MMELLKEKFEIFWPLADCTSAAEFTFSGDKITVQSLLFNISVPISSIVYFENIDQYCLANSIVIKHYYELHKSVDIFLRKLIDVNPCLKSRVTIYKNFFFNRVAAFINAGVLYNDIILVQKPCNFRFLKYRYDLGDDFLFLNNRILDDEIPFVLRNIADNNKFFIYIETDRDEFIINDFISRANVRIRKENVIINERLEYDLNGDETYYRQKQGQYEGCIFNGSKQRLHKILEKWIEGGYS